MTGTGLPSEAPPQTDESVVRGGHGGGSMPRGRLSAARFATWALWGTTTPRASAGISAQMCKLQRRPTWSTPRSRTGLWCPKKCPQQTLDSFASDSFGQDSRLIENARLAQQLSQFWQFAGLVGKDLLGRTECVFNHEVCHGGLLQLGGPSDHVLLEWTHSQLDLVIMDFVNEFAGFLLGWGRHDDGAI